MTTNYGLCCLDCQESGWRESVSDTYWQSILEVFKERENLSKVMGFIREMEKVNITGLEVRVSLDFGNTSDINIFVFLEEHKGHHIVILDEYGNLFNENREKIGETDDF